ncbi:MAG: MMPL family transporter [Frankia sp.]|nr:MMPL family transporter [Frankia sp.]
MVGEPGPAAGGGLPGRRAGRARLGRVGRWLLLLCWLAVIVLATPLAARLGDAQSNDAAAFLSPDAESSRVLALQRELPGDDAIPAVVVFARDGGLTAADQNAISAAAAHLAPIATAPLGPPIPAPDGEAAMLVVPLVHRADADAFAAEVRSIRTTVRGLAPPGLETAVTGPAGVVVDTYTLFSRVDTALLLVTACVVAVILLIVYRSPLLWLVPLTAVAIADQVATAIVYLLARHADLTVNGQSAGILRVLVFGAGTDYALLLIARYREELTRYAVPADAMRVALRRAAPAIVASAGTVVLGLLCLLAGELNSNRGLGPVGAIGIVVSLVTILTLLPAAMVVCGRGLFWPFIPRLGGHDGEQSGLWARVGAAISRRPRTVWLATVVVLGALATGLVGVDTSLRQQDAFRETTDAVTGQRLAEAHFPPGATQPTYVVGRESAAREIGHAISATPGIAGSAEDARGAGLVQFLVVLADPPDSQESYDTIERLREAVHAVPGGDALVGGNTAANLDVRTTATRDQALVIPLVLVVVLMILGVVLRSVVAAVLLIATVALSFLAALGVSALVFRHVFEFPGSDPALPLYGFIFLVALGVDYNIFLMTRVREEAARLGPRPGVRRGLAVTGGVITSAGVVLAATFSVLFIFPLVQLAEIGFLVAFGVLLDTLVVRSVLVPALALDLGRAMWWPSRLSRRPGDDQSARSPSANGELDAVGGGR